jgi:hypothetical protein
VRYGTAFIAFALVFVLAISAETACDLEVPIGPIDLDRDDGGFDFCILCDSSIGYCKAGAVESCEYPCTGTLECNGFGEWVNWCSCPTTLDASANDAGDAEDASDASNEASSTDAPSDARDE